MDWWFEKRQHLRTWAAAKEALQNRYGDQFVIANAWRDLEALQQTGRIQEYLTEVNRLNGDAKLPEDILMDLITRKIKPRLREMMAPFTEITQYTTWERKLISCGNSLEQNDRINKNTKSRLDQYRSYNCRDNDKRELRKQQTDNNHPANK